MNTMKKNMNFKKDVLDCKSTTAFKAYMKAFDECKMHKLLANVVGVEYIRKAKKINVSYTGDNWDNDALMVACMLPDVA